MQSKYDETYKREILKQGLDKKVAKIKRDLYKRSQDLLEQDGLVDEILTPLWTKWVQLYSNNAKYDCAIRLNESKYRKAKKIRDKIGQLIKDGNAYFLTLTFRNDVFTKTSQETRRKYVARYLKTQSDKYVANIDYGGKKGREHYHAIVNGKIDYKEWFDNYGVIHSELIRNQDQDVMRTSKYISKLTNHAIKVEGIQPRLIYSRDTI